MMKIKTAVQWKTGAQCDGVFRMPSHTVTDQRRGITFDRPEGFYADTPFGRQQLVDGSWLLTCESGNRYVVKEEDVNERRRHCRCPLKAWIIANVVLAVFWGLMLWGILK